MARPELRQSAAAIASSDLRAVSNARFKSSLLCAFSIVVLVFVGLLTACTVPDKQEPRVQTLPFTRSFPARTQLKIRIPPAAQDATSIVATGDWTLNFAPTEDPSIAAVSLVDADITFSPFRIEHDVDGDGKVETAEVESIHLDRSDFDLDATRGIANLQSGEFRLLIAHRLDPARHAVLRRFDLGVLNFDFEERGVIDLERGIFLTHTEPFALPQPLARVGLGNCESSSSCRPKILAFDAAPRYVCSAQCRPGFQGSLFATARYLNGTKSCNPADSDPGFGADKKLDIRNDSKGLKVKVPKWKVSTSKDYYSAQALVTVENKVSGDPGASIQGDTWFGFTTFDSCGDLVKSERVQVKVLPPRHQFQLCTQSGDLSRPGRWAFSPRYEFTGNLGSIVVQAVTNGTPATNPFAVKVETYGVSSPTPLGRGERRMAPYQGLPPDKPWAIEILAGRLLRECRSEMQLR